MVIQIKRPRKFILYGNYGTGKTYSVRSLKNVLAQLYPDRPKALVLDIVEGAGVLAGCEDWIDVEDYKFAPKDAEGGWLKLATRINQLVDTCSYGAVVLDDLSGWERLTMYRVLPIASRARDAQMKKSAAAGSLTQRDPDQADYGQAINMLGEQLNAITSIDAIVIVNAHQMLTESTEIEGRMFGGPYVIGRKFPATIGQYFDEIYHTVAQGFSGKDPEFRWETMPDSTFYARSRLVDAQGKRILERREEPSYEVVYRKAGYIK